MANKLYEESSVSAIAAAIRRKNGQATTYTIAEMAPAIDALNLGYTITNGIIEQYKASTSTISADTFVEFVEGATEVINSATIATNFTTGGSEANTGCYGVCKLSNDKVFLLLQTNESLLRLSGAVITLSGDTISAGAITTIDSTNYSGDTAQMCALSDDKVFLLYSRGTGHNAGMTPYCRICSISGTTITAGTAVQVTSASNSGDYLAAAVLDSTHVFISVSGGRTVGVCTISGNTVSVGTLNSHASSDSNFETKCALLDTNKVILLYSGKKIAVCNISGSTVSVGTATEMAQITDGKNDSYGGIKQTSTWYVLDPGHATLFFRQYLANDTFAQSVAISSDVVTLGNKIAIPELDAGIWYCCGESSPGVILGATMGTESGVYFVNYSYIAVTEGGVEVIKTGSLSTTGTENRWGIVPVSSDGMVVISGTYLNNAHNLYADYAAPDYTIKESVSKIDGVAAETITTSTAGDVWVFPNSVIYNGDADIRRY